MRKCDDVFQRLRLHVVGSLIRWLYGLTHSLAHSFGVQSNQMTCDVCKSQLQTSGQQTMKKKREARMRKAAEASSDQDLGTTDEDQAVDKL